MKYVRVMTVLYSGIRVVTRSPGSSLRQFLSPAIEQLIVGTVLLMCACTNDGEHAQLCEMVWILDQLFLSLVWYLS